ncbi:YkgJ family cysteine cluster protein [Spongorhabdus nitratireducens]
MQCRLGCGACCIAPSISSSIPGMPKGKPASVRCIQLDEKNMCRIFGSDDRPDVCSQFTAEKWVCGETGNEALQILDLLEQVT